MTPLIEIFKVDLKICNNILWNLFPTFLIVIETLLKTCFNMFSYSTRLLSCSFSMMNELAYVWLIVV